MSKKAASQDVALTHPVRRWLWLGLVLFLVLIPTFLGAVWLYRAGKVWRAHSLAAEAMELMDRGSNDGLNDKVMAAYQLVPYDAQVIRACARYSISQSDPQALVFYQQLLGLPEATREDKRAALRASLLFGNVEAAKNLATDLTNDNPEADDWVCKAQVLWQMKAYPDAVALMRKALEMSQGKHAYQLLMAQMLASSDNDANQEEAMTLFRNLAKGQDQESLAALIAMSRALGLDKDTLRTVLKQLREHPLRDDSSRFAAWELEAQLGDRDPKVVMQDVVTAYKSSNLPQKAIAARWLYGHNQPDLALELATPADSLQNKELFLVRIDALGFKNDWPGVMKELMNPACPIPQAIVFLYRARASDALGDRAGSDSNWDRARDAATTDPGMLDYLGNYAMTLKLYHEAQKTFERMTQSPTEAERGYEELVRVVAINGTSPDLLVILHRMTVAFPKRLEAKNDWAYLSLLLNVDMDKATKAAQELVDADPKMLAYRSTLALSYLRHNDFSGAAKVYQGLQIDWTIAPPSWQTIYAVVLAANGDNAAAQEFARKIDRSQLHPEERNLLRSWVPGA